MPMKIPNPLSTTQPSKTVPQQNKTLLELLKYIDIFEMCAFIADLWVLCKNPVAVISWGLCHVIDNLDSEEFSQKFSFSAAGENCSASGTFPVSAET